MKYIAFRIDITTIREGKVINGFFVRGQRSTDYNWQYLGSFATRELALDYIKSIRTNQTVYDNAGYEIKIP